MKLYIRFLNLKNTLLQNEVDRELDLTSQKLLDLVALSEHRGQRMTVSESMSLSLASPATLHRKIDELLAKNYVTLEFDGQDKRTKYVTLTKKSIKHFSELGKILIKSLAPAGKL